MGDERPGSVIKGPAITVTCDCGERTELFYGERWACPACGRAYDTRQVPEEEYAAIRRVQRRFRALPIALGLAVAALAIFFTLTGQVLSVFVLLPLSVATWFAFIRPLHRRRFRAAIADLPRWNLRAE
jgi:Flp pilus assembly protein TadB